jgi:predicted phage-related endonuclease
LKFANTLKEAGVPDKQAEAEARALKDVLSDFSSERLDDLTTRRDFKELETTLRRDMKEIEIALRRDMKESELKLEAKIADTKAELVRWVVGVGILQMTLIAALLLLRLTPG